MTGGRPPESVASSAATGDGCAGVARWPVLVAALLPLCARALSYTDRILDRDEAYWMAPALRMRDAGVPIYVAGWDTKPPLPFLLHRFGLAVAPDAPMLGSHVLAAVIAALACAAIAAAAQRLAGTTGALLAGLAFALLDSTGHVRALAANSELASYLPLALVLWTCTIPRAGTTVAALLAGAGTVAATMAKLPAIVYGPAACVALLAASPAPRPWVRVPLLCLVGGTAVAALTASWLWCAGSWDDFVACNVTMSLQRAAHGAEIAGAAHYDRWLAVARANWPALLGAALAIVFGVLRSGPCRRAALGIGPLAAAGLFAAVAGGAAFPHYLQLAWVPIAALAGVGLAEACSSLRIRALSVPSRVAIAATLAVAAAMPDRLNQWRSRSWPGYDSGPIPELRERVRAIVPPGGAMFVWGIHPDLYVTCLRAPATRYVSAGWLVGSYSGRPLAPEPFEFVPGSWDRLFDDLARSTPALVVDSVPAGVHGFSEFPIERFPRLHDWLRAGYTPEAGPGGYVLWVRRRT